MNDLQAVKAVEKMGQLAQVNAKNINQLKDKMSGIRGLINEMSPGQRKVTQKLGEFVQAVARFKQNGHAPDGEFSTYDFQGRGRGSETMTKSATTQADGNAGYLIPDLLMPEVQLLAGQVNALLERCRVVDMPPGSTMNINLEATRVLPSWRMAECTEIPESEVLLTQDNLTPGLLGSVTPVSSELFNYPGGAFAQLIGATALVSFTDVMEAAIIQADSAVGGAAAPPADGILVDTNTTEFVAGIALPGGFVELLAFLKAAITADPSLMGRAVLVIPPHKAFSLLEEASGATTINGGLGMQIPANIAGFPLLLSQAASTGAADHAILVDPQEVLVGGTNYEIDVNPYGAGWTSNCIALRLLGHRDWMFTRPGAIHWAAYATV